MTGVLVVEKDLLSEDGTLNDQLSIITVQLRMNIVNWTLNIGETLIGSVCS